MSTFMCGDTPTPSSHTKQRHNPALHALSLPVHKLHNTASRKKGDTVVSEFVNLAVRDLVILRSLISMSLLRPFVTGSDKSR
jgi:hypothetical protein